MKGDFSRQTFNKHKHYSRVLMQQGRVQIDADWNEQQAILQYLSQTEATDVIGVCGTPADNPGFTITVDDRTLLIGPGRYYVDGILCENEGDSNGQPLPYTQQPDFPSPPDVIESLKDEPTPLGLVYLDVWQRHLTALDDSSIREKALGGPDTTTRSKTVWQVKVLPVTLDLDPLLALIQQAQSTLQTVLSQLTGDSTFKTEATRLKDTIDTTLNRLMNDQTKDRQSLEKVLPFFGDVVVGLLQLRNASGGTPAVIIQLDTLALEMEGGFLAFEGTLPEQAFPEWRHLLRRGSGTLKARTSPVASTDDPCLLPPGAGYLRLENQLYRVEIHQGGDTSKDQISFKWSRDNGSVVTTIAVSSPVTAGDTTITVDDVGPDNELGFAATQVVEVLDDTFDLNGQPGQLIMIAEVTRATGVVKLVNPINPAVDVQRHAKLRRWDGTGNVTIAAGANMTDWITLEGGIQVQFASGTYKTGDYWLIPARTANSLTDAMIEWPVSSSSDEEPLALPPFGIQHHYCCLALLLLETQDITTAPPSPPIDRPIFLRGASPTPVNPNLLHSFRPFNDVVQHINIARETSAENLLIRPWPRPVPPGAFQIWDCRSFFRPLAKAPSAMHVISTNWLNDSLVPYAQLFQLLTDGLVIFLDEAPDPVSLVNGNGLTMIVALELPVISVTQNPSFIILDGVIEVVANAIRWRYRQFTERLTISSAGHSVESFLASLTNETVAALATANIQALRFLVTLKGHTIWSASTPPGFRGSTTHIPQRYLDGQAFGMPGERVNVGTANERTRIALLFPSGTGGRASDFESWFYGAIQRQFTPLQVSSVRFLAVSPDHPDRVIQTINVSSLPKEVTELKASDQLNALEVTFNRAVGPDGFRPEDVQKGVSVDMISDTGITSSMFGTVTVSGAVVRFTEIEQRVFPAGSFKLVVGAGAAGPQVKAADDGTVLDGDFDNQPGGNFVLLFKIV